MDAVYGCDGCATTIGRAGCPTHRDGPVGALTALWHRHRWVFDGAITGGVLYHCDEHDPPETRLVLSPQISFAATSTEQRESPE